MFLFCLTTNAEKNYVEIITPSMVEYLKNWFGIEPNEKGLYSMDTLQRVYRYNVTELPLPLEFRYLKNIGVINVVLDPKNEDQDRVLDLRPFANQFGDYLHIKSLSSYKLLMGEETKLTMLVIGYNCEELDISKCINLEKLICKQNMLEKLDLKNNVNLEELDCSQNRLKYLDLSYCKKLRRVDCSGNLFATMDSLLLPSSVVDLKVTENKFSRWPQFFYVRSYPKLENLQLNSDVIIKLK